MDPRSELRDFLMSRRSRISPEQVGISSLGTRRVAGLRRDEVAMLAGISTDYYGRIENGMVDNPSESVLEAVARALRMDEAERAHLGDLVAAGAGGGGRRRTRPAGPAPRPSLQWMIDAMTDAAAFVTTPFLDLVAVNHLARAIYAPMLDAAGGERPNFAKFAFLAPASRELYPDWEGAARAAAAQLRVALGRHPGSRALSVLVGELATRSVDFRTMWAAHEVRLHVAGTTSFDHPAVGAIELSYHTLDLPSDPGRSLTIYNAVPHSPSADALRLLASWAAASRPAQGGSVDRSHA